MCSNRVSSRDTSAWLALCFFKNSWTFCIPSSWGILVYNAMTSTVAIISPGWISVFWISCKKWLLSLMKLLTNLEYFLSISSTRADLCQWSYTVDDGSSRVVFFMYFWHKMWIWCSWIGSVKYLECIIIKVVSVSTSFMNFFQIFSKLSNFL